MSEILCFLDAHNGAVTAVATAFMALFTFALIVVSAIQSRLIGNQVRLGRDEFNATHRPEISILSVGPSYEEIEGEKVAVQVMYVNKGQSPAKNVRIQAKITIRVFSESNIELGGPEAIDLNHPDLASGMKNRFSITSGIRLREAVVLSMGNTRAGAVSETSRILCLGCISYYDGVGGRRETAFCRVFNVPSDRWEPGGETKYEYSY